MRTSSLGNFYRLSPLSQLAGCCMALLLILGGTKEGWSQQQTGQVSEKKDEGIYLNFDNVDIRSFLQAMSDSLQVALVWDEKKVKGTITVLSPQPFERVTAMEIFESVLSLRGYAIVQHPSAPLLQVVPVRDVPKSVSKVSGQRIGRQKIPPFSHTEIIQLRYADGNAISTLLRSLSPNPSSILLYKPANVLMLTESQATLQRMKDIIKQLDAPSGQSNFEVFKLKYAEASKLAPVLRTLGTTMLESRGVVVAKKQSGSLFRTIQIQADVRTNSLLVIASKEVIAGFRDVIREVDIPPTISQRKLRVFRLEHANAEELVKIFKAMDLKSLAQNPTSKKAAKISISADKATNSLVVFGPVEIVNTVSGMLTELDVRPPQVFVEVLVMEMSLEKSLDLGVRWQALSPGGNSLSGGGFPSASPLTTAQAAAAGDGALIGVIGNTIAYDGQNFTSFSGFIRALQKDQDVNIVANPQVLTVNNKQAEINVSSVIPVSTRTVTNTQNQTTTEFEFRDVGVILKITPQITSGNRVRLIIKQEFSSISSDASSNIATAITTLKRSINTEVVVDDKSTMAIGGLIHNQTVNITNRVPFLSRIWIIGNLFKSRQNSVRKTNLLVFIRPTIISSQEDGLENSRRVQKRYDKTKDLLKGLEEELKKDFTIPEDNPDPKPDNQLLPPKRLYKEDLDEESFSEGISNGNILSDEMLSLDFSLLPIPKPNLPPEELLALEILREQSQKIQYVENRSKK